MKNLSIIGSTGSIGRQTLEIVRRHGDKFRVVGLCANNESELFSRQVAEFSPAYSGLASKGDTTLAATLPEADIIVNAAAGFDGAKYSFAAFGAGKRVALANKETLVCGGELALAAAQKGGSEIIPVDSEHSAIWQCLNFDRCAPFKRLIITASGGAFRGYTDAQLDNVTAKEALAHPTWQMGKKITIDSATLANKGYEVIEAHVLYGAPYDKITTVIQPTSVVHSLVEFEDGGVLAQLGTPSMELPIQIALTYPERLATTLEPLDFSKAFELKFEPLAREKYPLYSLALSCGEEGGIAPAVFNAADEVAVWAFIRGEISFKQIFKAVEKTVSAFAFEPLSDFGRLGEVDKKARETAARAIKNL